MSRVSMTADEIETAIRSAMSTEDWQTVAHLERLLSDLTGSRPTPGLLASALWYAEQGLKVFPLQAGSKVPHPGSRGCKDATSSEAVIRQWWQWHPDSNLAIATGHLVDVIDIDGPVGVQSWSKMRKLPPILGIVSTPRDGGNHLYVAATGDGNSAAMYPGVDYRGVGGYVVAPPSVNADGKAYRWRRPLDLGELGGAA